MLKIANALRYMTCEGGDVAYSAQGVPHIRPFGGGSLKDEVRDELGDTLPWSLKLENSSGTWKIEIYHCALMRGYRLVTFPDKTFTLNATDGDGIYHVGVKINTNTHKIDSELILSKDFSDLRDIQPPDDEFFKKPLYELRFIEAHKEGDDLVPDEWQIASTWYRLIPELGAYV